MKKSKNEVSVSLNRWKTQYNYEGEKGQVNNMPSLTSPDKTMTLVELIDKFASGQSMAVGARQFYDGIADANTGDGVEITDDLLMGVKWDSLDLVEKHQILADSKIHLDRVNEGIRISREAIKKRGEEEQRKRKEYDDKIEKWLKAQEENPSLPLSPIR